MCNTRSLALESLNLAWEHILSICTHGSVPGLILRYFWDRNHPDIYIALELVCNGILRMFHTRFIKNKAKQHLEIFCIKTYIPYLHFDKFLWNSVCKRKNFIISNFCFFAKIKFSLFFIGQKSQIRKNNILNFFVRKHTSLISILTNLYKILNLNNNFLLLATFAIFEKIEFSLILHRPKITKEAKQHHEFCSDKTYIPYPHFDLLFITFYA